MTKLDQKKDEGSLSKGKNEAHKTEPPKKETTEVKLKLRKKKMLLQKRKPPKIN